MIEEWIVQGMTRAEIATILIDNNIVPGEVEAEFMIAIALGEVNGDVVMVDEQGNEIERPVSRLIGT